MQSRNPSNSRGIDISHYQTIKNWNTVKDAGISFVFVKSTEGSSIVDSSFQSHFNGAKSVGMKVGVYHFCRANNVESAIQEADFFISVINANGGFGTHDIAPVLDLETPEGANRQNVVSICRAWIDRVKQASGMIPILYSYPSFADEFLDDSLSEIPLWLANYNVLTPRDRAGWKRWVFLQYSEQGKVAGISGYVDVNEFDGDIKNYIGRIIVDAPIPLEEDEENMTMKLSDDQWQRLNNIYGQRYNAGEFTDWSWMQKIRSKTMTVTELALLNALLEAKKDSLSIDPNAYGMDGQ